MKSKILLLGLILLLGAIFLIYGGESAIAQTDHPVAVPVDQIIVKYKADANLNGVAQAQSGTQMQRLSDAAGVTIDYFRPMSGDAHVLRLPERMPVDQALAITDQLSALPEVEYAEPDYIMFPMGESINTPSVTPNDPQYSNQWHYFAPTAGNYGVNAPAAWDITTGSSSVYVAVLDTGILNHADLSGRWTGGYDMISDSGTGNDGDGRDSDPHDPGDWVAANECGYTHNAKDSSWHGTHVAGTIGAATNNSVGVAGLNWVSQVVPVRVLGKCGGNTSDIADGIRWAAGLSVSGVPANVYPAKVMNLSLGGYSPTGCPVTTQAAVDAAYGAGSVVVVAAGNSNDNASDYSPASCNNVITVAATDRNGDRAYYSNYGSVIEISGPGGAQGYANDPNGVLSTLNTGTTVPVADSYEYYQGTSMAAPHLAGVVSLLYSVNPSLTPAQALSYLQSTVTAFPGGSSCNTSICGSGIVNAGAAVAAASGISTPTLNPISNGDGDGNYTVSWSAGSFTTQADARTSTPLSVTAAYTVYLPLVMNNFDGTTYTLQEDDNAGFASPTTVYNGTGKSWAATGKPPGTYYYRVMSSNSNGDSTWSNIQSVMVAGPSNWVNITTLDFEGDFPGSWTLLDDSSSDGGEYYWGKRNCQAASGSYSGWAVGGGSTGSGLGCGSNYPNDARSWMTYGPFSLAGAQEAELSYKRWLNSEPWPDLSFGDWLCAMHSTDGTNFIGSCGSGNTAGWEDSVFDLAAVTGESQVWVTFFFKSDVDTNLAEGAYIDDVVLRKCDNNCITFSNELATNPNSNVIEVNIEQQLDR